MGLKKAKARDIYQKSRINWLKFGDENTAYFHKVVNINAARNRINGLRVDEEWVTDPDLLKNYARLWFRSIFKEPMRRRPDFTNLGLPELETDQANSLTIPFGTQEVLNAIRSCDGGKAPGPDGFTMKFFKKYWGHLKVGIMKMMADFYHTGDIGHGCNATFIALIAKVPDPQMISDYRPISLVSSLYKIISKVLASRLKEVFGSLISPVQSAFVGARNIIDTPLILGELISWAKKTKFKMMVFKVDFQRAYDSVNWKCLLKTMEFMKFPPKWIQWIRGCLVSARGAVLVNGSPSDEFSFKRGLRQGDPLSPFLFIIVMEVLNMLMNQAVNVGLFRGVQLPNNGPRISHLCFADDVVFVGEWSDDNATSLVRFLRCLNLITGLQVNHKKCKLFGVNVHADDVGSMATKFYCEPGSLPFTYLGIPLGANMKLLKNWEPILTKLKRKLSTWKKNYLSFAGRVTLAKSVLGSVPSYYLSLFAAPKGVIKHIEGLRRDFVWGKSTRGQKIRWINWNKVMRPKDLGGFGLGGTEDFNIAMLSKWWWRFKQDPNQLWVRVIAAVHKSRFNSLIVPIKKSTPGLWKAIIGAEKNLLQIGISINSALKVTVGDGRKTKFWKDPWLVRPSLKEAFPALFLASADKEGLVSDFRVESNEGFEWNFNWHLEGTQQQQQPSQAILEPFILLLNTAVRRQGPDNWAWHSVTDGSFSVRHIRLEWHNKRFDEQNPFIFNWNSWAPSKANYLLWRVLLDRVASKSSLAHRGVNLQNLACDRCSCGDEDTNHLFLNCIWARSIWWQILVWIRIPFPMDCSSISALVSMVVNSPGSKKWKKIVYAIVIGTIWMIWKARNTKAFDNIFIPTIKTTELIKEDVFCWITTRSKQKTTTWEKWLDFDVLDML